MEKKTLWVAYPTRTDLALVRDYDEAFTVEDAAWDFVDEMAERGLDYDVKAVELLVG